LLDAKIAEATVAMTEAETTLEKRKAKEKREDLMRLKRVEQIYVSISNYEISSLISPRPECRTTRSVGLGAGVVEATASNRIGRQCASASPVLNFICFSSWSCFT
jgi:hypothetical protein